MVTGSTHLRDLLTELDGLLRETGAPVAEHLRAGVPAERVIATMGSFGLEADPDVATWFGWHDGTDTGAAVRRPGHLLTGPLNLLLAGLHLLTLEQAATELTSARALEPDPDRPIILGPGWFPFLKFTDGWLVCVDTHSGTSPRRCSCGHRGLRPGHGRAVVPQCR